MTNSEQCNEFKQINENTAEVLAQKLQHNVLHNRFDIYYDGKNYELYEVGNFVIPVIIKKFLFWKRAILGLVLTEIPKETMLKFCKFLFKKHCLMSISWKRSLIKLPCGIHSKAHNYWYVKLPDAKEEFDNQLGSSTRYNSKRDVKNIIRDFGNMRIEHKQNNEIPTGWVERFFKWKMESYKHNYNMTAQEWLKKYHINSAFALFVNIEGIERIVALIFLNEIDDIAYLDQISFIQEQKYRKYSFGVVLYYATICDLISRGKKMFYLAGGNYRYKQNYNGICVKTYDSYINIFIFILYSLIEKLANLIKTKTINL